MDDLAEASKSITTLKAMMDQDVQADCVRRAGSHTRNLLRVKRGLDMVKVLFEQIIASEYAYYLFPLCLYFSFITSNSCYESHKFLKNSLLVDNT